MSDERRSAGAQERPCLVCGGARWADHLEILRRCASCGFVTARTEGPIDPAALYGPDYFHGAEYLDYPSDEPFFKRNFRRRLRDILRYRAGGRLVEIGAAYGFFLELAAARFDVVGFEINPEAVRHAREVAGLDVRGDDFLAVTRERIGGPVDVTVMWDVIEHLERPDAFVAHAAALSSPGAMLFLTTGDIGSRVARLRGRRWRMIHPPTHLHYFDRHTITRLLDRHGFEVVDLRGEGVARSLRQIAYAVLVLNLGLPRAWEAARRCIPAGWGLTVNTFDIMRVAARKRG